MKNRMLDVSVVSFVLLLSAASVRAWEPNANDLDRAIGSGEFSEYQANIAKWINTKTPAAITEDALKPLLKDAGFMSALAQHQFVARCGADKLGEFAKADKAHREFLTWLMKDTGVMDLYLEAGGDGNIAALTFWKKIYQADPDSRQGIYLKVAIAVALQRSGPFQDERGTPRVTDPYEGRYLYYKKAHQGGELLPSFNHLTVWEYRKVVDALGAPPEDLTWVREMLRTWRPDLRSENRLVKIVSEVKYGTSPLPIVDMASVLDAGGMCERRANFGMKTCAAFGVPSIKILQRNHAALAWKQGDGTWKVEYGAGWGASWLEGGMDGGDFVAEAAARSHAAEFSQSEHLKWFAAALTSAEAAKAITAIATAMVPRSTDSKAMARDPDTKPEMEANAVSQPTSAAATSIASQAVSRADADAIRIDAANFIKMANVMVYDSHPDGSGKQLNFQKNLAESWVEYNLDAPKAGTYALVMKLAAPNRDQVLTVAIGTNAAATINVPNARGLWGMTSPLDLRLEKGSQTLRFAAPFQRGIAVKWIELRLK